MRGFLLFAITFIFLLVPLAYSEDDESLIINIQIIPEGVETDKSAYVVGDFFHYNISLFNEGGTIINDSFSVVLYNPLNETPDIKMRIYDKVIHPNEEVILFPYQEEGNWDVFPFNLEGTYKMVVSSTKNIKFVRCKFTLPNKKCNGGIWYYKKFNHYFDAMPKWQYDLWKKTEEVNDKLISANKKFAEANEKLIGLTDDMNRATETIKTATIIMLIVVITTLYIASTTEEDKKGKLFKFIRSLSKLAIICLIIYFVLKVLSFL